MKKFILLLAFLFLPFEQNPCIKYMKLYINHKEHNLNQGAFVVSVLNLKENKEIWLGSTAAFDVDTTLMMKINCDKLHMDETDSVYFEISSMVSFDRNYGPVFVHRNDTVLIYVSVDTIRIHLDFMNFEKDTVWLKHGDY